MIILCPSCKKETDESSNFCPYCGFKINKLTSDITFGKRTKIYLISFFLSPLGIIWFFKYYKNEKKSNRKVAYTALILTIVPLLLSFLIGNKILKSMSGTMGAYENTINTYSELGL